VLSKGKYVWQGRFTTKIGCTDLGMRILEIELLQASLSSEYKEQNKLPCLADVLGRPQYDLGRVVCLKIKGQETRV